MSAVRLSLLILQGVAALAQDAVQFKSTGNPILADGSYYSADPAPLVVNNTLYIIAGHDEAPVGQNSFVINEWELFVADSPDPSGGEWTLHPGFARPHEIFSWAQEGTAYAAQIVQGPDGRFYLYAPVTEADSSNEDPFAIGVAVADNPLGPWTDAHPDGPVFSQSVPTPGNDIQNIDPTILVDDDGKVYVYWGTFGQLRGYEMEADMVTTKSDVTTVNSLTGFFEAPWIMKRKDTYYLLYAANNAGPDSPCTPTSYHACIAYGTASSPLGPWTFQDVILGVVSSTTSHSGAVELDGQWYLIYHTADAEGGAHFRRSVAFDRLTWDDSQSPPAINKVVPTKRPSLAEPKPTRNIAPKAKASSEKETPIQYWVESLHDGKIPSSPLPPDYWSSYDGEASPQQSTLVYKWNASVTLNGVRMAFFADQDAGANIGVPPPTSWHVEYQTDAGSWEKVANSSAYPLEVTDDPEEVSFDEISTTSLRAILTASGGGSQFGGVAVKEWEALAPTAQ